MWNDVLFCVMGDLQIKKHKASVIENLKHFSVCGLKQLVDFYLSVSVIPRSEEIKSFKITTVFDSTLLDISHCNKSCRWE